MVKALPGNFLTWIFKLHVFMGVAHEGGLQNQGGGIQDYPVTRIV